MALNDGGVAIRYCWDVKELIEKKRLIPLLENYRLDNFHSVWIVYPSKKNVTPRVRELINYLESELKVLLN